MAGQGGDVNGAIGLIQGAIIIDPEKAEYHSNLGMSFSLHQQVGANMAGAIAAYRKAISIRSDIPETQLNLGIALAEDGAGSIGD